MKGECGDVGFMVNNLIVKIETLAVNGREKRELRVIKENLLLASQDLRYVICILRYEIKQAPRIGQII